MRSDERLSTVSPAGLWEPRHRLDHRLSAGARGHRGRWTRLLVWIGVLPPDRASVPYAPYGRAKAGRDAPPRPDRPRRRSRVHQDRDLPGRPPRIRSPHAVPVAAAGIVLAVCVAFVASLAAVGLTVRHGGTGQAERAPSSADPGPGGFAELVVSAWLRAGGNHRGELEGYLSGPVDLTGVPSDSFRAVSATTLTVLTLGGRHWSVLVAVERVQRTVDPATKAVAWQEDGTHYYRVGVHGAG